MKKERLSIDQINDENSAREFVAGKLIDLVRSIDERSKKNIKNQMISYKGVAEYVGKKYNIDTTAYDRLATKLLRGVF